MTRLAAIDPVTIRSHCIFLFGAMLGIVGITTAFFGVGKPKADLWIALGAILTACGFMIASHSIRIDRHLTFLDRRSEDVLIQPKRSMEKRT